MRSQKTRGDINMSIGRLGSAVLMTSSPTGPMGKKVAPVRQPTSPAGRSNHRGSEDGLTLLEAVCVIAILAILAGVILPRTPHGTTRARLESYAIATAALLKKDRDAAVRRQLQVET